MNSPMTPASTKDRNDPVPARAMTPGTMMKTEDAGVTADSTIISVPSALSARSRPPLEFGTSDGIKPSHCFYAIKILFPSKCYDGVGISSTNHRKIACKIHRAHFNLNGIQEI